MGDPRLRGDDIGRGLIVDPRRSLPLLVLSKAEASKAEWAGMTEGGVLGGGPLGEGVAEAARRSPPEPALSKAEWAGMTWVRRADKAAGARGRPSPLANFATFSREKFYPRINS
jgi:hypothetical protein